MSGWFDLKTKQSTLKALERAAHQRLTADEIQKQRISFVMGCLDVESLLTRAMIEKLLNGQQSSARVFARSNR